MVTLVTVTYLARQTLVGGICLPLQLDIVSGLGIYTPGHGIYIPRPETSRIQ
jgi:hypothetical protein